MTSLEEISRYPAEQLDADGLVNPGFITEPAIRTRNLEPGITASRPVQSSNSLPDILNSHLPPPYEAVVVENDSSRRRRRLPETEKSCCRSCWTSLTRFKWLLWTLSGLGMCCALTGVVLGLLHMTGSSFLTLSIMFIGLGVMMLVVVLIGWRCTPRGHEPCHLLFNLGEYSRNRRRHCSTTSTSSHYARRREYGRRAYWSGGVIYSDHQHRQPPPSYAAAMQDFERQILARMNNFDALPNSPPPTYKSQASMQRPGMRAIFSEQPPNYTSRAGTLRHNVQNNLDSACTPHQYDLSTAANIIVHQDNVSRQSLDDNLSRDVDEVTDDVSEHAAGHSSAYGTAERNAVQCLENSIREEGVVNRTLVLEDDRAVAADSISVTRHGDTNDAKTNSNVELNTASLLRAADQNLQRFWARNEASSNSSDLEPRFGSARAAVHTRPAIGEISHIRSSSASGDLRFQDHVATLV